MSHLSHPANGHRRRGPSQLGRPASKILAFHPFSAVDHRLWPGKRLRWSLAGTGGDRESGPSGLERQRGWFGPAWGWEICNG